jgi:hypothetical protein
MANKVEETAPAAPVHSTENVVVAPPTRRGPVAAVIAGGIVAGLALFGGGLATGIALPDGNGHGPHVAGQQLDAQRDARDGQRDGEGGPTGPRPGGPGVGQQGPGQQGQGQQGQGPQGPGQQGGLPPVAPNDGDADGSN